MKYLMCRGSVCVVVLFWMMTTQAGQDAPWGRASLQPDDIHGFVKVVPMVDAEIVRPQQEEGYAYMR